MPFLVSCFLSCLPIEIGMVRSTTPLRVTVIV
ncbi:Uncharacterised protein [Mycobacteroides abscessus subsp. abscessus]|nr:Uncharacterised protein [Mycobacteroides abscessus subsp. abscessus]